MSWSQCSFEQVKNVGINAIEFYFPRNFVEQTSLEIKPHGVGKNTIGLGQQQMGFCGDNEDIVSISLTVTRSLLETYQISTNSIGCLVVGTETLIDKSKSVKTSLMDLFEENTDIEGVDIKNACFGGTQALLHAVDWVTVNYPVNQKHAIVVISDIAVYAPGAARCTGGAGAMAFLITPEASIPIDRQFAGCHMKNTWDFYKPITSIASEFPVVEGELSLSSYLEAVKMSYEHFIAKVFKHTGQKVTVNSFDAIFFHSPFTKMVQKGIAYMCYTDSCIENRNGTFEELNVQDRAVMKQLVDSSVDTWEAKTDPYLTFNRRIGNMYTPSVFAQLLCFLASDDCVTEGDKNILFFAYGSGLASAVFPGRVRHIGSLEKMRDVAIASLNRLDARNEQSAEEFTATLNLREEFLRSVPSKEVPIYPRCSNAGLFPNTYYLKTVNEKYQRTYAIHEEPKARVNGNGNCLHH